jgi:D-amino-acid dehydrogenase
MRHRPLFIWPTLNAAKIRFGLMMLRNCTSARYQTNKSRMVPISEYSRDLLRDLRVKEGIAYDERSEGTLQLFRSEKMLEGISKDIGILQKLGVPYERLDRSGCIAVEPALDLVKEKIAGGLRLPGDETGDCFKFTSALAAICRQRGVEFRYQTSVKSVLVGGGRITGVTTSAGEVGGDAYVMALGSYSPLLLRGIAIDLPVYPVKGYSLTIPITNPAGAPESTVMDETHKVAVTRLGDRIRVGGIAELDGYNLKLRASRRKTLEHVVADLFPGGGDLRRASYWCGLRPMTPDGPPVIGPTKYPNLFLNTGMAPWVGRWPAVRGECSRTCSRASGRRSTSPDSRSPVMRTLPEPGAPGTGSWFPEGPVACSRLLRRVLNQGNARKSDRLRPTAVSIRLEARLRLFTTKRVLRARRPTLEE